MQSSHPGTQENTHLLHWPHPPLDLAPAAYRVSHADNRRCLLPATLNLLLLLITTSHHLMMTSDTLMHACAARQPHMGGCKHG